MNKGELQTLIAMAKFWDGFSIGSIARKDGDPDHLGAQAKGRAEGIRSAIKTLQTGAWDAMDNASDFGEISDGYHTFNELYAHRHALLLALMKVIATGDFNSEPVWISQRHRDGPAYAGWFIAGINLPTGPITYHLPDALWLDACATGARILDRAPEFDGHTSADVLQRLHSWIQPIPPL